MFVFEDACNDKGDISKKLLECGDSLEIYKRMVRGNLYLYCNIQDATT